MYKTIFTIGEEPHAYIGYTNGNRWNGWATPYFELAEAKRVACDYNKCAEYPMQYDDVYDQFYVLDTDTNELEVWQGVDIHTTDGTKHLYGIGAYAWVWDKVDDSDIDFFADIVEEFIYEYDTYAYKDIGINREEMRTSIKHQLMKFETFKQVYEILNNDELSEDEKFEEFREVLK